MGRKSLWKRLWQQIKRVLRALIRVSEGPRAIFRFLFHRVVYPAYEFSIAIILPPLSWSAHSFLPNSLNPFVAYKEGTSGRVLDAGHRTRWMFEKYVHTRYPEEMGYDTYEEQMKNNPSFVPFMSRHDSPYMDRLDREEEELAWAEDRIRAHFREYDGVMIEEIPEDFDEQYRQAIGARTTSGWVVQKIFFWWADILDNLENILWQPLGHLIDYISSTPAWHRLAFVNEFQYWRTVSWPILRDIPYHLGNYLDEFSTQYVVQPLYWIFAIVNTVIGVPASALTYYLWANWMTFVYFPFQENIYEPIFIEKLYNPIFRQPFEDLVRWDPLIGRWAHSLYHAMFLLIRQFVHNPIAGIFSLIHRIILLPGDLLYLVYLFFLQLEDTLYFYFLYPLTEAAIKNHGFGTHFMERLWNIFMSFIHLVGYTRPTAILAMSAIFTSLLVFFLNLIPI